MWDGKKTVAQKIFYDAMDRRGKEDEGQARRSSFRTADQQRQAVRRGAIQARRRANYQVPMQVNKRRQQSLAFRWIIGACRDRAAAR
jgi:small subunit ribosomal protein S7